MVQNRITSLIEQCGQRNSKLVSFEIFPEANLNPASFKYNEEYPSFFSVVWNGHPKSNLTNINEDNVGKIPAIELAKSIADIGYTVLLHLTCIEMKKNTLICILDYVKSCSIQNLLLLQGDGFNKNCNNDGFSHTSDLIRFIRENYDNYFCIGIAGFPQGHPDSQNLTKDMEYIKLKIDAGANFIISQMFFESEDFVNFVKNCRNMGIDAPIIPGLSMFPSYSVLIRMSELTQLPVPQHLLDEVEPVKNDSEGFSHVIRNFTLKLIENIFENKLTLPGIHWFTFNSSMSIFDVLKSLSIFDDEEGRLRG
ncbi:putative methylenetetrahydrofolate reductase (NADPH) [Arctopsyche grandis]|uniref:putative methylenetetrahydrofolate reductase (NADPH) n=1 Tax=Arctopsyche grandis TaxID=121162 RepID=UPI00406D73F3